MRNTTDLIYGQGKNKSIGSRFRVHGLKVRNDGHCIYLIANFGFGIGGIASLYPLTKQAEYLKSKIRIPNSKIDI